MTAQQHERRPAEPESPDEAADGRSGSYAGSRARAWESLLRYHARVVAVLSAELEQAGEVSWGRYDVLAHLEQAAPGSGSRNSASGWSSPNRGSPGGSTGWPTTGW